jgi:hypothetical protein
MVCIVVLQRHGSTSVLRDSGFSVREPVETVQYSASLVVPVVGCGGAGGGSAGP